MQVRISNDGQKFPWGNSTTEGNDLTVMIREVRGSNHNWTQ